MTAAVSQQLWTSGGALVQRAQESNIPFGESLTSIRVCFPMRQVQVTGIHSCPVVYLDGLSASDKYAFYFYNLSV